MMQNYATIRIQSVNTQLFIRRNVKFSYVSAVQGSHQAVGFRSVKNKKDGYVAVAVHFNL